MMLHLPETDLKKTRFYQEVFREGEASGRKEGEASGRKEGEASGRKEGELTLILRLLKRRLGTVSAAQRQQIEPLSVIDLDALGDALLDFSEAGDLDRWLRGRRGGR